MEVQSLALLLMSCMTPGKIFILGLSVIICKIGTINIPFLHSVCDENNEANTCKTLKHGSITELLLLCSYAGLASDFHSNWDRRKYSTHT